jgi:hypothetical protein
MGQPISGLHRVERLSETGHGWDTAQGDSRSDAASRRAILRDCAASSHTARTSNPLVLRSSRIGA